MEMILPTIIFVLFTTGSFCILMSILVEKPIARYNPVPPKPTTDDALEQYMKEEQTQEEEEGEFEINADLLDMVEV